jgi:hypothetical protein
VSNKELENLPKETLIELIKMYSKNWNTVDGLWFRGVEDRYGTDVATEMDKEMWMVNVQIEAKRIMEILKLEGDPLDVYCKVIEYTTSMVGDHFDFTYRRIAPDTIEFSYTHCHPQHTRIKQGLQAFPCKQVGIAIQEKLAEVVDPRIKVKCLWCPPDPRQEEAWCRWEFKLSDES